MVTTLNEYANSRNDNTQEKKKKVSFEEYLELTDGVKKAEWVDGEIVYEQVNNSTSVGGEKVFMAAASIRHELLFGFLLSVLRLYVQRNNLGIVLGSDVAMKLEEQQRGREPDVLFIGNDKRNLIRENFIDGAADMVVEVISPESIGRDRGEKFIEYEAAGIREYWLIDPQREQAEFYRLNENGLYRLVNTDVDGIFRSDVIQGFWLRVEWLWTLPNELDVLRELHVI
jgi:Uma2 family endonuclease